MERHAFCLAKKIAHNIQPWIQPVACVCAIQVNRFENKKDSDIDCFDYYIEYKGYVKNDYGLCLKNCDKKCPKYSTLNPDTCNCTCINGYKLNNTDGSCYPTCNKCCLMNQVQNPSDCNCACRTGYIPSPYGCRLNCNLTCPIFKMVNIDNCTCQCIPGFEPDPQLPNNCRPICKKCCGVYSVLNLNTCSCDCIKGYSLVDGNFESIFMLSLYSDTFFKIYLGNCRLSCNITCPSLSYLDSQNCQCVCAPGYELCNGSCIPTCTKTCPPNAFVSSSCNCACLSGFRAILDQFGNLSLFSTISILNFLKFSQSDILLYKPVIRHVPKAQDTRLIRHRICNIAILHATQVGIVAMSIMPVEWSLLDFYLIRVRVIYQQIFLCSILYKQVSCFFDSRSAHLQMQMHRRIYFD